RNQLSRFMQQETDRLNTAWTMYSGNPAIPSTTCNRASTSFTYETKKAVEQQPSRERLWAYLTSSPQMEMAKTTPGRYVHWKPSRTRDYKSLTATGKCL